MVIFYAILPSQMKSHLRGTFMGNWVKSYVSVLLGQKCAPKGLETPQINIHVPGLRVQTYSSTVQM